MSSLWITEYANLALDSRGNVIVGGEEPALTTQVVSFGASTASSAFQKATRYLTLYSDAACHIEFGTAPTATTSSKPLQANYPVPVGVKNSAGTLKLAVISAAGSSAVDTELPAAAALADNTANPTAPAVGSFNHWFDGATWDRAPGTSAEGALVNLGANNDVTITGTVTISGAVTNSGTFAVQPAGSVAHDGAAGSVNPVLAGGYASAAAPADVSADADAVQAWHLRNGAQATVVTAAGALIGGDAANGLDVDVTRLSALVAGSAVIGKVGIDQTTPGTTNGVQVNAALPAGTNNIGDVDVLSIAAGDNNIGNVDIVTQPARAATADTITVKIATDAIQNGTTALTPKFAIIDGATSGDNTLVAAVSSKKIRVLSLFAVAAGTTTVRFESGAGGTALTGQMNLIANVGFVLPFNPVGWFETAATTLLNMELSAAISVDGSLVYVEV